LNGTLPPTMPEFSIRAGHPDFLDLPWETSLVEWQDPRLIWLPKGISRHEVRFLQYPRGIYAIKELPERAARRDHTVLRTLETKEAPAVRPVGLVTDRSRDPHEELSAALITEYEQFSFSYRELVEGPGFGARRSQMLDAFAGLLVELHLAGCFWGDCSLSNVLYRYDAEAIETIMVDGETAFVLDDGSLSTGQREEDLEIMIENVAGGMADIAARAGHDVDEADLELGIDIAGRYRNLWDELNRDVVIRADERYRIQEAVDRLNELGFEVTEVDLVPVGSEASRLRVQPRVGGRNFHVNRLKELTGLDVLGHQARQILADLQYHQAALGGETATGKHVAAVRWRVDVFEPWLQRLSEVAGLVDPVQAYCDLLHHRYVMSQGAGHDAGTEAAFEDWLERGRPGYPLEQVWV
jgi:hypothetical protein